MARYKILKTQEVSDWIGMPAATLKTHRSRPPKNHEPVPFFYLPNGRAAYREDQVQEWLDRQPQGARADAKPRRAG